MRNGRRPIAGRVFDALSPRRALSGASKLDPRTAASGCYTIYLRSGSALLAEACTHPMQEFWPVPENVQSLTPLLGCIQSHKVEFFVNAATTLLFSPAAAGASTQVADVAVINRVFHTRVLPEIQSIRDRDTRHARHGVIRFALALAFAPGNTDKAKTFGQIVAWLKDSQGWKVSVEETINDTVSSARSRPVSWSVTSCIDYQRRMASHSSHVGWHREEHARRVEKYNCCSGVTSIARCKHHCTFLTDVQLTYPC